MFQRASRDACKHAVTCRRKIKRGIVLRDLMTDLDRYASMVSLTLLFPKHTCPKRQRNSVNTSPDWLWEPRNPQLWALWDSREKGARWVNRVTFLLFLSTSQITSKCANVTYHPLNIGQRYLFGIYQQLWLVAGRNLVTCGQI